MPGLLLSSRRGKVAAFRESLRRLEPLFLKIHGQAASMMASNVGNPLKLLPLESPDFDMVSRCANFLLMVDFSKELASYKPERFERFKGKLDMLISDLETCARTLASALDVSGAPLKSDSDSIVALLPPGLDKAMASSLISKVASDASVMPSDSPLDIVWNSMMRLNSGRVLCFDGEAAPETWAVPKGSCLDIKTRFEPTPHDKTVWIPGYKMLCVDEDVFGKWRSFAPQDVECSLLEERV